MAPGPSSHSSNGASLSAPSTSTSSSAHALTPQLIPSSMIDYTNFGQALVTPSSTGLVPSSAMRISDAIRMRDGFEISSSDTIPDLKHCAYCGILLEIVRDPAVAAAASTSTSAGPQSGQEVILGNDVLALSDGTSSTHVDTTHTTNSSSTTDDQGRLMCQSCQERMSRLPLHAPPLLHNAASAEATRPPVDIDASFDAFSSHVLASTSEQPEPSVSADTPLSIAIGASSFAEPHDAVRPHQPPQRISSTSRRTESLTRTRPPREPTTSSEDRRAVVNVPSMPSNPAPSAALDSHSSSKGRMAASSAPPPRSRPLDTRIRLQTYNYFDDGNTSRETGPAAMTRPRLSALPPSADRSKSLSANRSKSPSASRVITSHLSSPFSDPYREQNGSIEPQAACAPYNTSDVAWYQPHRPDPTADVSRLRMPPRGRGCLYPGALFRGTQKSGTLSYDVTVEILNVDLPNSHLEGYLNILGLTEDWPEMTTYFTAEIIGKEHGFITNKWGATQADDMKHWARFAPFESLRPIAKQNLKFNHLSNKTSAIFMRWKERFLVPDWRVKDIHGASFAGFYYVCVEFGDMEEWDDLETACGPSRREQPFAHGGEANSRATAARETDATSQRSASVRHSRTASDSDQRLANTPVEPPSAINPAVAAAIHSSSPPPRTRNPVSERRLGGGQHHSRIASLEADDENRTSASLWAPSPETPIHMPPTRSDDGGGMAVESLLDDVLRTEQSRDRQRRTGLDEMDESARTRVLNRDPDYLRWLQHVQMLSTGRPGPFRYYPSVSHPSSRSWTRSDGAAAASPSRRLPAQESSHAHASAQSQDSRAYSGGRITAFYYHANSEPYQQLDLRHVPQRSSATFEMR